MREFFLSSDGLFRRKIKKEILQEEKFQSLKNTLKMNQEWIEKFIDRVLEKIQFFNKDKANKKKVISDFFSNLSSSLQEKKTLNFNLLNSFLIEPTLNLFLEVPKENLKESLILNLEAISFFEETLLTKILEVIQTSNIDFVFPDDFFSKKENNLRKQIKNELIKRELKKETKNIGNFFLNPNDIFAVKFLSPEEQKEHKNFGRFIQEMKN